MKSLVHMFTAALASAVASVIASASAFTLGIAVTASLAHAPAFAADPAAPAGSVQRGKELYMKHACFSCHGTVGQGGERGAGPRIAPDPSPWPAFKIQMRTPRSNMPRYPEQFVSRQELADMHAYLVSIAAGPKADSLPIPKR